MKKRSVDFYAGIVTKIGNVYIFFENFGGNRANRRPISPKDVTA
jgi:hypothetical protein